MAKFDLILKGGLIIDPANDFEETGDLGIASGHIERVAPEIDSTESSSTMDVSGKW